MLKGLYTSASPNLYPSYHALASSNFSGWPKSASIFFTSASVNPNLSSDLIEKMLLTLMLFRSENMLSLAICITPVTYAIWRWVLFFSAAPMIFPRRFIMGLCDSLPNESETARSYSSMRMIGLTP